MTMNRELFLAILSMDHYGDTCNNPQTHTPCSFGAGPRLAGARIRPVRASILAIQSLGIPGTVYELR